MHTLALLVILEAKPGKEQELSAFLKSALPLAAQETQTSSWFAFRIGTSKFGIFDTFPDEDGRNAHINGEIAKALFAKAEELLVAPPQPWRWLVRDHVLRVHARPLRLLPRQEYAASGIRHPRFAVDRV